MRLYVANLAAYVSGRLIGSWFDLDDYNDAEHLREDIHNTVIAPHGGEEWAIHDTEGFGSWTIGEYESLDLIWAVYEAVAGYPGDDDETLEAITAWINHNGSHYADESLKTFQDAYHGKWESGAAFAEDFIETTDGCPSEPVPSYWSYIDWERYWHGEFECAAWFISNGHVFNGNSI